MSADSIGSALRLGEILCKQLAVKNQSLPFARHDGSWFDHSWLAQFDQVLTDALDELGLSRSSTVGLIPRNRPHFAAALTRLMARLQPISMIYAFQSPAGIARDIASLKLGLILMDAADWNEELAAAARVGGSAILLLSTGKNGTPMISSPEGLERIGSEERRTPFHEAGIEMLTSGTTGPPKRQLISYRLIEQSMVTEHTEKAALDPERAAAMPGYIFAPFGNIAGIYQLVPLIVAGRPFVLAEKFTVGEWVETIRLCQPATIGLPPAGFRMVLDADVPVEALSCLKAINTGAAPLDPAVQKVFEARYGVPVLVSYGATEFGGPVTMMTLDLHREWATLKEGTVGRPWADAELRVVDAESGIALPAGNEGVLEVRVPRVGGGWIRTSDIALIDGDGFVFMRGRADGAISRGGFKVVPEVVAAALELHPAVAVAAVVGIPDERLGKLPVAAIELAKGATAPTSEELTAHARQHLFAMQVPVRFKIVDTLPRTPSLKISLRDVGALFANES